VRRVATSRSRWALGGLGVAVVLAAGGLVARDQLTGGASSLPPRTPAAQVLVLLNQRRAKAGLKPLRRDLVLAALARSHNQTMRRDGFFAHDDPQGQTFFERLAYLHRSLIGETLAYGSGGFGTPKGIVSLWMASPPHRRVILTPGMRRVGISIITGRFLGNAGISLATADYSS
jgi:uncharacterized protein YkwD